MAFCQIAFSAPIKRVLFTLNPNEEILWGEYISNVKLTGYKFICIINDKVSKKQTLVWNGQRKIFADWISISYIDVNDYSKCIFTYKKGDKVYLQFEKETFGPYESVWINDCYPMIASDYRVSNTNYFNRCEFAFKQLGDIYIHDNDGTIYKKNDGKYDFVSPNRNHHAKLTKDKRVIVIDGTKFVLPIPVDGKVDDDLPNICLFNDGSCYFTQWCSGDNWTLLCYYITDSELFVIDTKNDYLDLDTHKIKSKSMLPEYCVPFGKIPWGYDKDKEEHYLKYEFSLQDKSKKHFFNAKWDYDYVLVDGIKYGKKCPIDAFYDEGSNSFGWTVIENNQITLYTLRI